MKTIKLTPTNLDLSNTGYKPKPSVRLIPPWFKNLARHLEGKLGSDGKGNMAQSVKACSPFLDSLSMGYLITLESDVLVKKTEDGHSFEWAVGGDLMGIHGANQLAKEQVPTGYDKQAYKFNNHYSINTPIGYSVLITHPLNRTDLPFITLSAVVDTDGYELPINFPFLLKSNFEGILEAGTPIAQVIPIKREPWSILIAAFDGELMNRSFSKVKHKLMNGYKSQFWHRKDYK